MEKEKIVRIFTKAYNKVYALANGKPEKMSFSLYFEEFDALIDIEVRKNFDIDCYINDEVIISLWGRTAEINAPTFAEMVLEYCEKAE